MKVIDSIPAMQAFSRQLHREGKTIGFVPTMGYLHQGHLSLMRIAREKTDVVVASIFVNPTQFGPNEDFDKYPRDFDRDERLCREAGVDVVFYPTTADMYLDAHRTYVVTDELSGKLCGMSRPIHFRGVTTVVTKLFNIVQPDVAVFGQKDAQQSMILRRMVKDLNFGIEIIVAPIVREADGLAMSSRNRYLSSDDRGQATVLNRALRRAAELIQSGEHDAGKILTEMNILIATAPNARIDYIEIVNFDTLEPVKVISGNTLIALAVYFNATRLLDNIIVYQDFSTSF